jgi:hypothetical protein
MEDHITHLEVSRHAWMMLGEKGYTKWTGKIKILGKIWKEMAVGGKYEN